MSEWKKYDETTFTDFGSVGETMPVESGSISYDKTMPADGAAGAGVDMSPFAETIPENAPEAAEEGFDSWNQETVLDNMGVVNDAGETVRPATGWLVCINGMTKGTDYKIYQGYTYIGRDPAQNRSRSRTIISPACPPPVSCTRTRTGSSSSTRPTEPATRCT